MTDGVRAPWRVADPRSTSPLRMVTLNMLADKDYLALARTCAMHIAAVLGFPLTRVTDLRLAVNEACLCFLEARPADLGEFGDWASPQTMEIGYDLYPGELQVSVRAAAPDDWPRVGEAGWALLRALVGDVRVESHEGLGVLTLVEPLPDRRR